jgi:NAD-dependent deacetylase
MAIVLDDSSYVFIMTGSGVSAESGIDTFRDSGGLWEGHKVSEVATPEGFERDPFKVWNFYSDRRAGLVDKLPNAAHHALAALEERLGDRFLMATQNFDSLHTTAGNKRVLEMHGNLLRTRCTTCNRPAFSDTTVHRTIPMCDHCQKSQRESMLRPDIVWFGEPMPPGCMETIAQFITTGGKNLIYVAIGTSGLVYPAAGLVDWCRRVGGKTWLVNLEAPINAAHFHNVVIGPATREVPALFTFA